MVTSAPASTNGSGSTVIVTWSVFVHPVDVSVTVTVYVVVIAGVAIGLEIAALFKLPALSQA